MQQFIDHYEAIKKRGLITPESTVHDFMDKLEEEFYELRNEYAELCLKDRNIPTTEMVSESVDLIMVLINMFQHFGYDFMQELKSTTLKNQKR